MKRAYLIYQKDEAEKNKGFIELFRQAGKREKSLRAGSQK